MMVWVTDYWGDCEDGGDEDGDCDVTEAEKSRTHVQERVLYGGAEAETQEHMQGDGNDHTHFLYCLLEDTHGNNDGGDQDDCSCPKHRENNLLDLIWYIRKKKVWQNKR